MKYDERTCKFNMDTGCVELLLGDGRKISIDCTGVEDALDVTMAQRSELDYLVYNDPLSYDRKCRTPLVGTTQYNTSECKMQTKIVSPSGFAARCGAGIKQNMRIWRNWQTR